MTLLLLLVLGIVLRVKHVLYTSPSIDHATTMKTRFGKPQLDFFSVTLCVSNPDDIHFTLGMAQHALGGISNSIHLSVNAVEVYTCFFRVVVETGGHDATRLLVDDDTTVFMPLYIGPQRELYTTHYIFSLQGVDVIADWPFGGCRSGGDNFTSVVAKRRRHGCVIVAINNRFATTSSLS